MDQRLKQLQTWVAKHLTEIFLSELDGKTIPVQDVVDHWEMVAGDASLRRYFRVQLFARSFIVMDAPPEHEDVAGFVRIAELMRSSDIRVPLVHAAELHAGFLILEDFGDDMLKRQLKLDNGNSLFNRVLPILTAFSACKTDTLPVYSAERLRAELELFPDWFLARHCGYHLSEVENRLWADFCCVLLDSAVLQPQIFVHRDFHSCNLHALADGDIGVIDFQDAVLGPSSYDLVSWLWDRYIDWPRDSIESWMLQAKEILAKDVSDQAWIQCCDYMGLQRNLKIIGIFARLYYRDGMSGYLEMIPQFIKYVRDVIARYESLAFVRLPMDNWLQLSVQKN